MHTEELLKGMNIYLIGMMGTGKSTVGELLAQKLEYRFFDSDILIERVSGQSIPQIFAQFGEEEFRHLESKVMGELAACTRSVIATGGGVVTVGENWGYMRHGLIIWLDVPVEVLEQRLAGDKTRPLLPQLDILLEKRRSLYAQADLRITVEEKQTPEDILDRIISTIPSVLVSPTKDFQSERN